MRYSIICILSAVVLAAVLTAPCAHAQVDPDTSGVGIYFEPAAETNQLLVDPGPTVHSAYVCATNLPAFPYYEHYSFRLVYDHQPGCFEVVEYILPPGTENWVTAPDFLVANFGNFTWQPSIVLLEFRFTIGCVDEVQFFIEPYVNDNRPFLQVWLEIGGEEELTPSSGSSDLAVAAVNGLQPIAVETVSWSRLRALYR